MRIQTPGRPHLTYCTNVHPAHGWEEVRRALARYLPPVKARVSPESPFGVGLRLSGTAAEELETLGVEAFRRWLDSQALYVFTLNGFPHGAFHGTAVKEAVYRPDWLEPERLAYTDRLARLLADMLPEGESGSISTVPIAFRDRVRTDADEWSAVRHVVDHVATLARIHDARGVTLELALEPEPRCFLETTGEAVRFFQQRLLSSRAEQWLASALGVPRQQAAVLLRRHLGVCLDACHAAVEFEEPHEVVALLRSAGVRIGKIQLTTGLEVRVREGGGARRALEAFADGVYLHQVVVRQGGGLRRYRDLPDAFVGEAHRSGDAVWRVHFHVPVFAEPAGPLATTRPFLESLLREIRAEALCSHLEVETYTWDVLPEGLRGLPLEEAIAREIDWVTGALS